MGSSEGFHRRSPSACLACVADLRASAITLCVAICPNFACHNIFSRFTSGAHLAQYTEPVVTPDPQRGQRALARGMRGVPAASLPAFAWLRCVCVSLVGRKLGCSSPHILATCRKRRASTLEALSATTPEFRGQHKSRRVLVGRIRQSSGPGFALHELRK